MGYKVQSHWGRPVTEETWQDCKPNGLDAKKAIYCIRYDADLSRVCCPLRAINEHGHVIAWYEPDDDMRLPGAKWRMIAKIAETFHNRPECVGEKFWCDWEESKRADQSLVEFWDKAETQLPDTDGFHFDPEYANLMQEIRTEHPYEKW